MRRRLQALRIGIVRRHKNTARMPSSQAHQPVTTTLSAISTTQNKRRIVIRYPRHSQTIERQDRTEILLESDRREKV